MSDINNNFAANQLLPNEVVKTGTGPSYVLEVNGRSDDFIVEAMDNGNHRLIDVRIAGVYRYVELINVGSIRFMIDDVTSSLANLVSVGIAGTQAAEPLTSNTDGPAIFYGNGGNDTIMS